MNKSNSGISKCNRRPENDCSRNVRFDVYQEHQATVWEGRERSRLLHVKWPVIW